MSLKRVSSGQEEVIDSRKKRCMPVLCHAETVVNGDIENGANVIKSVSGCVVVVDEEPCVNKTRSALIYLRSLFPMRKFDTKIPPIVLRHQLYSLVPNHGLVDLQLDDLWLSGEIKLIPNGPNESVIILLNDDYRLYALEVASDLGIESRIIDQFLKLDPRDCRDLTIANEVLTDRLKLSEDDINQLEKIGLLSAVDDDGDVWAMSIPYLSSFTKTFSIGRKALLTVVGKSKCGEILQQELLQHKLPRVVKLGTAYHVHDLVGANLVDTQKTSAGLLLRLNKRTSSSSGASQTSLISFNADVDVYDESV